MIFANNLGTELRILQLTVIFEPGVANCTLLFGAPAIASEYVGYKRKPPSWSTLTNQLPFLSVLLETNDNVDVLLNSTKSPVTNAPELKLKLNLSRSTLTSDGFMIPEIISPLSLMSSTLPALPR